MQTRRRFTEPATLARTRCRFGNQQRFVLLFAWLTLLPTAGPFPQIPHLWATATLLEASAYTIGVTLVQHRGTGLLFLKGKKNTVNQICC